MKPTTSQRALGIREMPERERPISEVFRLAGDAWVLAEYEYDKLKALRDTVFERRRKAVVEAAKRAEIKMTLADAEREVVASDEWEQYERDLVEAKRIRDAAWVRRKEVELQFQEWVSSDANSRKERAMGRQSI